MRVRVLYFGVARDLAGRREEQVSLEPTAQVEDLLADVEKAHPGLARLRAVARVAVEGELAQGEASLSSGQTVAIIPPVAGG